MVNNTLIDYKLIKPNAIEFRPGQGRFKPYAFLYYEYEGRKKKVRVSNKDTAVLLKSKEARADAHVQILIYEPTDKKPHKHFKLVFRSKV